jgi:hypothetical protein
LRYNYELYNKPDIMKMVNSGRLRWLGHLFRMQEQNPCRKLTVHKPEDTQRVGRPAIRWLDSIKENMKIMGVRNWRRKTRLESMESNHGRGQGSLWTVAQTEEDRRGHSAKFDAHEQALHK